MNPDVFRRIAKTSRTPSRVDVRACAARLAAMVLLVMTALPLAAQQVNQVADLFTGIGFEQSSFNGGGANGVIGGLTYFTVQDREHGSELWVTDGTAANTHLFADICPGLCSGQPADFFVDGTRLYFSADDGRHGREPWRLRAGDAAPTLIADVNPGADASTPSGWSQQTIRVGNTITTRVYFSAFDRDHGRELWRLASLGTVASLEADIEPGSVGSAPEMIGSVDGGFKLLVLATTSANGREPYLIGYDSFTTPPSSLSLLLDTSINDGVVKASVLGGKAWFTAFDSSQPTGQRGSVWSTDGTAANTIKLLSVNSTDVLVPNVTLNRMFFTATATSTGKELYVSDGTVANTGVVKDVNPNSASAIGNSPLVARGGVMLFLANDGTSGMHGTELWSSDGSSAGTNLLKELVAGSAGVSGTLVGAAGNTFAYVTHAGQLWRSDGTAAGTTLLKTLGSSAISGLAPTSGSGALFGFNIAGTEPWFSDGTAVGTVLLGNFNDGIGDANAESLAPIGERMSFMASDDSAPFTMHSTSGSGATVWFDQQATPLGYLGARLLFIGATSSNPNTLQLSDGTAAGTSILPGIGTSSANDSGPPFRCSVALNGSIWFIGIDPATSKKELYRSDGSAAGAIKVSDVAATGGFVDSCFGETARMVGLNGQVLFAGDIDDSGAGTGIELMRSNGVDPVQMVADINPGSSDSLPMFLTALGNKAVFAAHSLLSGFEPWVTDGTAQGTKLLKDITPGPVQSNPENLVLAGNQVFFTADNPASGRELWVTDGTPAGTRMVVDLYPGSGSAFRQGVRRALVAQGRRVYFHALVPADNCALFVSDGTAAGTRCAVDPLEGLSTSGLDEVLALPSGVVAFTAWRASDGDEVRALRDGALLPLPSGNIRPGAGSSQPMLLTATPRGTVYFSADDGSSGREVWRLDLTDFIFADDLE